jgi:serine/threonine protein kinase/dipeptidyl aminopeptidase/acylaminoacyl peptidase
MVEERRRRINELFLAALEHEPEARLAFLETACGDNTDLRRQVELLLAKQEKAASFLETPAIAHAGVTHTATMQRTTRQFGAYRIVSSLGSGGMGQVFRAHDSKLGRDVAVKFLPPEFARDPDRLARFRREARTLASLNHPHIGAIFGLEEDGDVECLVLELMEGETLRGPLPVAQALEYARQVAEALEAAHAKGIVHRDLKPSNIMVTPAGQIKVFDFGLAKAIWGPDQNPAVAPTTGAELVTLTGHIVGTPGYMSPEQSSGTEVDSRTDIWAFGCILYELLTGKRAFAGETLQDTMAAVKEREPDWRALPPKTPPKITALLQRCLDKAASRRLQNITEARVIVEQSQRRRSRWGWAGVAAGLAIVIVGSFWSWRTFEQQPNAIHVPTITRLTTDSGLTAYPALSPDGKLLAYASDRASNGNLDIWIQQTAGGNPVRLTTNEADDLEPSFSPDGSQIAFRSERDGGGVYVVPATGGVERRLADPGRSPRFSPDGKWIAYWVGDRSYYGRRAIFVIPASGGQRRSIQPGFYSAGHPVWSPDSKRLLFLGVHDSNDANPNQFDWWVSPLDPGPAVQTGASEFLRQSKLAAMERSQLNGGFGVEPGEWTRDSIVFSASSGSAGLSGSLWRVNIDSQYRIQGPVQRLTSGTENELQPSAAASYIAFANVRQTENIWRLRMDPNTGKISGEPEHVTTTAAADILPASSADGRKVAFASNRNGNLHIWIKDLANGTELPLTSTPFNDLPYLLSADGSQLVYCVFGAPASSADGGCFIRPTSGGVARRFCPDCPVSSLLDWFDHERKVLYKKGITAETEFDLRDIDSGRETVLLRDPQYNVTAARFSRDGRWMSFQIVIEAATRRQIFITPIRNGTAAQEPEWIPITDGTGLDRNAVWSPDGNLLYFLSERDGFRCVWAQRLSAVTKHPSGAPFAVYHFHQARRSLMPAQEVGRIGLSVTRDELVFSMAETSGNIWLANFQ